MLRPTFLNQIIKDLKLEGAFFRFVVKEIGLVFLLFRINLCKRIREYINEYNHLRLVCLESRRLL